MHACSLARSLVHVLCSPLPVHAAAPPQVLAELRELMAYRARYLGGESATPIMAVGLSSRKNLCCHPTVSGA